MSEANYKFPCGCEWPIIGDPVYPGALPRMRIDRRNPPFCSAVASLFASGKTKGLWQLEKPLGQTWSKKLAPTDEEMVSALVAILRPGMLKARDEKGSMTEHYVWRRHGVEVVPEVHPVVDEVLKETFGLLVYQEACLALVRAVAGFSLSEADILRRAMGKKDARKMEEVRGMFIEKATALGVISDDLAITLFDLIEKSNRYNFNKAHSYGYGKRCIKTAYIKAHFPIMFFGNWLKYAHLKSDGDEDLAELVEDAKGFGITINGPDFRRGRLRVSTDGHSLWLGLSDAKGAGESNVRKLVARAAELGSPVGDLKWDDLLFHVLDAAPTNSVVPLIETGAFDWTRVPRIRQLVEYKTFQQLTETETAWVRLYDRSATGQLEVVEATTSYEEVASRLKPLETALRAARKALKANPEDEALAGMYDLCESECKALREEAKPLERKAKVAAMPRGMRGLAHALRWLCDNKMTTKADVLRAEADALENPMTAERDTPDSLTFAERKYMGVAVTCTKLEGRDTRAATLTCAEYLEDKQPGRLAVEIVTVKKILTKAKQEPMGFLTVLDASGTLGDLVVFPQLWEENSAILREFNTVLLDIKPSDRSDGAIVDRIFQL